MKLNNVSCAHFFFFFFFAEWLFQLLNAKVMPPKKYFPFSLQQGITAVDMILRVCVVNVYQESRVSTRVEIIANLPHVLTVSILR